MSGRAQAQVKVPFGPAPIFAPVQSGLLQRKSLLGGAPGLAGEFADYRGKRLVSQPPLVQAKLTINQPNDRYEQEADRVAEQVMRMPEPGMQRQVKHKEEEEETLKMFQITPLIQRQVDPNEEMEGEEELILTKRTSGQTPQVSSILQTQIHSLRGGGQPLSPFLRNFFEPRFGHDFSRVRIHDDNRTAESARILNAQAYTVGWDVMFGAGRYSPETTEGRRLLAHELTHVTQQVSHVACNPDDPLEESEGCSSFGHREGSFFRSGDRLFIWGIWHEDDTHDSFNHRVISRWTRWAYRSASPPLRNRMILFLLNQLPDFSVAITEFSISFTPGCNYRIGVSMDLISEFTRAVRQEMQERARTSELETESQILEEVPSETSLETQPTEQGITTTTTDIEPEETTERHRALGTLESAVEEAERLSQEPITSINEDLSVLESSRLANHYLDVLEHYTNRSISTEDRTAAEDGLSREETIEIIGGNPLRRTLSALYTQGYCEFQAAGGSELEHFFRLEETIAEQFVRGNPTVTHNRLRIGFGVPEDNILGIVHRQVLYYDNNGIPLPAFGGAGMRDSGYIGSEQLEEFGINIANIEDLGLRLFLNALRQTFSDPMLMTVEAAQIYFDNVEQVNNVVQNGLSEEIQQRFEETLPFFIGFLAGHGLSTFLMRVPNPTVAGVGLALKGLLTAAGYIMSIDFAGQALSMLFDAAYHLSRVEQNEQGELTQLSARHLDAAAVPIRRMVAEVALSVTTLALTRALRGRATIECTRCRVRRVRRRQQRRYGRGQQLGLTRAQIHALRRQIINRGHVATVEGRAHRGALDHGVPDNIVLRTVNNPQNIMVSSNGSWVFYSTGTIVITPRGNPAFVNTAFGLGGHIPQRQLALIRRLNPGTILNIGDPEPPVRLSTWIRQQLGDFAVFRIWP